MVPYANGRVRYARHHGFHLTIRYEPKKILKRLAKKSKVEDLVTEKLTVNRAALNAIEASGIVGKKKLEAVAIKVIRDYREQAKELENQGLTKAESREEVLENKKLLVQRVRLATVAAVTKEVQKQFRGEFYTWLPSSAATPREEHKKKYGKRFQIGKGEMPGDALNCQCGMEIHVKESRLKLK